MKETIEKVTMNLDFYKGQDVYTDGDIEEEILEIVKNNEDFTEILANDIRCPILYHLTPLRRNLLEWYDFKENANILEIGAGCGALTGFLCEKAERVVVVELSKRRAEIIANRHKGKVRLEVIVGNLNDIKIQEKFDYITLIGVLEYAGKFTDTENPYRDFLVQVKKYLKPNGTLIIAIENKFGLKYWAGAREDHTGKLFEGIEGYIGNTEVKTFGKDELKELLYEAGYSKLDFYYPMPDYKIPIQIFSDEYLPTVGQIGGCFPNYDQERFLLFNEKAVSNTIIQNKKFDFFANSFLVFCKV